MLLLPAANCLVSNDYYCPAFFTNSFRRHDILTDLSEHVSLVARSVVLALLIAVPLALLVRRSPWARAVAIGVTGLLYTIPSVAAFALLLPFLGPQHDTAVVIVLTAYALLIVLRNVLVGLDGVPPETVEAARGMGMGRARIIMRVELPLALPAIVAGVRIATVSTIGIAAIAAVIGYGGLGQLLLEGQQAHPQLHAEIATALVLTVALAVVADVLLLLLQRVLTRWQRLGRAG
jgi:osmoprotectant transport system permease protein